MRLCVGIIQTAGGLTGKGLIRSGPYFPERLVGDRCMSTYWLNGLKFRSDTEILHQTARSRVVILQAILRKANQVSFWVRIFSTLQKRKIS